MDPRFEAAVGAIVSGDPDTLGALLDTYPATLAGSATYTWSPSTGNTVTIALPSGTSDQYVQLNFTANSVQNGAQISELELFGP